MLTSSHWALTEYQVLCSPYLETFLQGYKIGGNTFISQTRKLSPRAVKPSSKFTQLKYNGSGISVLFFQTVTLMFLCYSKGIKCSVEAIFWLEIPVNGCVTLPRNNSRDAIFTTALHIYWQTTGSNCHGFSNTFYFKLIIYLLKG